MSKNSIKIAVPKPCDANLDDMQTVGNGKFCTHCSKTVWDFTNWSEEELGHFFSNSKEPVCGKFLDFQLNKPLPSIPFPRHYGKIAAAALGFSLFFVSEGIAQVKAPLKHKQSAMIKDRNTPRRLIGIVADENGNKFPSVPISLFVNDSLLKTVFTDYSGCFEMDINKSLFAQINTHLEINSPRFKPEIIFLKSINESSASVEIKLTPIPKSTVVFERAPTGGAMMEIYHIDKIPEQTEEVIRSKITPNPIYDLKDIRRQGGN